MIINFTVHGIRTFKKALSFDSQKRKSGWKILHSFTCYQLDVHVPGTLDYALPQLHEFILHCIFRTEFMNKTVLLAENDLGDEKHNQPLFVSTE